MSSGPPKLASMHQSGVSDPEQEWINKYRAAIADSEASEKRSFRKMVGRVGFLIGIIVGRSQKLVKKSPRISKVSKLKRAWPQPLEEIGIEGTEKKKRGARKQNSGKSAA
jgi:hypothetical protein